MSRVTDGLLDGYELGLTLDRYQELMRIPIAAFNGLHKEGEETCFDCAYVWKQSDRDALALAIAQAEERRISELGYNPYPLYTIEDYDYVFPLILNRKHLVSVGSKVCAVIQAAVALTLRTAGVINDPVVVTVATTVTSTSEIVVRYPGEAVDIRPSKISISGGVATIQIPRSRLLKPSVETNCDPPPEYDDDTNFLATVDVYRCYTDVNTGAYLYWKDATCALPTPLDCYCGPYLSSFDDTIQQMYPHVTSNRLSVVQLYPGSYNTTTGLWTSATYSSCYKPWKIRISYLSGRTRSPLTEISTARLAHTLLPELIPDRLTLCTSCWKEDLITDENAPITPYGSCRAAIKVWMVDSRAKVGQGGTFPSLRRRL